MAVQTTEKVVKICLESMVEAGLLRRFWMNGEWHYVDNRSIPNNEELLQNKKLRFWKKPTKTDLEASVARYYLLCKEAGI